MDLPPIERRDELAVKALERAVRDVVSFVLDLLDGRDLALDVGEVLEQREQQARTPYGRFGLGVEVVEELVRLRHQFFQHAALYTPFEASDNRLGLAAVSRWAAAPRIASHLASFPVPPPRSSPARDA